jgi:DNA-binding NarL/FixJ family response regulator
VASLPNEQGAPVDTGVAISPAASIGVVVSEALRTELEPVLVEHEMHYASFASVDALLAGPETFPLILLCSDDALAATVAATVEPLRRVLSDPALVVVCPAIRPGEVRRALAGGVVGIVLADQVAGALPATLRAVSGGQVCVPRPHSRQVEPASLSMREKQILGLVVMGFGNGQIAERLFLAESTVKSHLSSAFAKLDVHSRNEAVDLLLDADRNIGHSVLRPEGDAGGSPA